MKTLTYLGVPGCEIAVSRQDIRNLMIQAFIVLANFQYQHARGFVDNITFGRPTPRDRDNFIEKIKDRILAYFPDEEHHNQEFIQCILADKPISELRNLLFFRNRFLLRYRKLIHISAIENGINSLLDLIAELVKTPKKAIASNSERKLKLIEKIEQVYFALDDGLLTTVRSTKEHQYHKTYLNNLREQVIKIIQQIDEPASLATEEKIGKCPPLAICNEKDSLPKYQNEQENSSELPFEPIKEDYYFEDKVNLFVAYVLAITQQDRALITMENGCISSTCEKTLPTQERNALIMENTYVHTSEDMLLEKTALSMINLVNLGLSRGLSQFTIESDFPVVARVVALYIKYIQKYEVSALDFPDDEYSAMTDNLWNKLRTTYFAKNKLKGEQPHDQKTSTSTEEIKKRHKASSIGFFREEKDKISELNNPNHPVYFL
ncbi:hypothetical protein [Legionella clemsonensis]|uniref:Uncharacterized protein n=1 Tax=Legionella clemsonensis TaxID=1867846 RepID=A0A222P300_9GAMM|nr:hypothetical protein [Legionella clemsonensis]ASQ46197.1 hypothetical protein clem_08225 [Legionella clemsonensis]